MYAEPTKPFSQEHLDRVCALWADDGYDDPTDSYLVLFSGGDADERPERVEVETICREYGLQTEVRDGELWIPKTQQLHDEIGRRWI